MDKLNGLKPLSRCEYSAYDLYINNPDKTIREIAVMLEKATGTIKIHLSNAFAKGYPHRVVKANPLAEIMEKAMLFDFLLSPFGYLNPTLKTKEEFCAFYHHSLAAYKKFKGL